MKTPEQQVILSKIKLIECTGGSPAFLKSLEARDAPVAQIDPAKSNTNPSGAEIVIKADDPFPDYFSITVNVSASDPAGAPWYEGLGYGHGPNVKDSTFKGSVNLLVPWDKLIGAEGVTFTWVPSVLLQDVVEWVVCLSDNTPAMGIGGYASDPGLVETRGIMSWIEVFPTEAK
ncbi:hypothetical protein FRB90_010976 [Tulasnella sp. 427]|nr:hypothetical protein FRB90_010976 [Tulasnella sp. 427]